MSELHKHHSEHNLALLWNSGDSDATHRCHN